MPRQDLTITGGSAYNCRWLASAVGPLTRSSATAERQRVSYTRLSRALRWTPRLASVVQLYNRLAKLVSTLSANKPYDIRGRWSFQTLYIGLYFQGHLFLCHLKAVNSFHNNIFQMATHLNISQRWCCIMWIITKFCGLTPVRRPSAVNPGENSYKPRML